MLVINCSSTSVSTSIKTDVQAQAEGHCGLWRGMPASSWRKDQGVRRWKASHPQTTVPTKRSTRVLGSWTPNRLG